MNILIGNQKGGTGKSTLTLLLANYLAGIRHSKVTIIDLDAQHAISHKAERAKILENEPAYEVIPSDSGHAGLLLQGLSRQPGQLLLLDLPASMDDDGFIPVLQNADLLLCPFNYDEFTVQGTLLFAMVVGRINPETPLVFVPNRIRNNTQYETRQEVDQLLRRFGPVSAGITDRIEFQRLSTVNTPANLYPVIQSLLDWIYETYILPYDHSPVETSGSNTDALIDQLK
jgi:chromosome partitioning protein